jgi:hypothetical protein
MVRFLLLPLRFFVFLGIFVSLPVAAQGLRLPERTGAGIDPTFARGWLAPDFDRFGFATQQSWKDNLRFAPSQRMNWSYSVGERGSFSMSLAPRELDYERQMSLYGRYWLSPDWAVSAESLSRDPSGLIRFNDLRIGIQRRF